MKNIRIFVSENFQFLEVKVSIYLNRRVFVMCGQGLCCSQTLCFEERIHLKILLLLFKGKK